jgi:DNA-binding response OmpR family regulator
MLPLLDGYSVARQLRADGDSTPILMLTARDGITDIVSGLDAGAEDYLTKPFSFVELLARLRSLLRRGQSVPRCLQVSDLVMDTASHAVTRCGTVLTLTKTEYLLLKVLMRNAGQVISREQIVSEIWGTRTAIEQNSIDAHIKALRGKVDQDYSEKLIQTIRGFGYKIAQNGHL